MANAAILIGNSHYSTLPSLACCHADLHAMKELLELTEKYSDICIVEDSDADGLKSRVREAILHRTSTDELFLYFTGHGYQHETDFFLCASNFDAKRPNATGISTDELHEFLRLANANLVVKVIDACNSGTLLVKADSQFNPSQKQGFENLIQISSCRQDQSSLTGEALSAFTEKFRAAALRKDEGTVYYTDIVNSLRDALGVPPKLIIFNGFLVGAGAQHCQGQIHQRDRFATTMTIPTRNGDFGATRAGSEWPARRAHSTACPNA